MGMQGRRGMVSFDPEYFEKEAAAGQRYDPRAAFRYTYLSNHWRGTSPSGPGSVAEQTDEIAMAIPSLCSRFGIRRLLDLPCGDFCWMAEVELESVVYVGADIVSEIVAANAERYGRPGRTFLELDLISSELPAADLILCRDCLVHLSFAHAGAALRNILRSDITFLLTTTFPEEAANVDITTGDWRPLNLLKPPFDFPAPLELVNEGCTENAGAFSDKSLALWRIADLRGADSLSSSEDQVTRDDQGMRHG